MSFRQFGVLGFRVKLPSNANPFEEPNETLVTLGLIFFSMLFFFTIFLKDLFRELMCIMLLRYNSTVNAISPIGLNSFDKTAKHEPKILHSVFFSSEWPSDHRMHRDCHPVTHDCRSASSLDHSRAASGSKFSSHSRLAWPTFNNTIYMLLVSR